MSDTDDSKRCDNLACLCMAPIVKRNAATTATHRTGVIGDRQCGSDTRAVKRRSTSSSTAKSAKRRSERAPARPMERQLG